MGSNVVKNPLVIWLKKNLIVKSKQKEIYEFVKMIKKSVAVHGLKLEIWKNSTKPKLSD